MLERVVTEPDNYAPFLLSQGIRYGNLLFISGQAGAADDGRIVAGGSTCRNRRSSACMHARRGALEKPISRACSTPRVPREYP